MFNLWFVFGLVFRLSCELIGLYFVIDYISSFSLIVAILAYIICGLLIVAPRVGRNDR